MSGARWPRSVGNMIVIEVRRAIENPCHSQRRLVWLLSSDHRNISRYDPPSARPELPHPLVAGIRALILDCQTQSVVMDV